MLSIQLLGRFQLRFRDAPLSFAARPKTLPLFAYLLLNRGQPVARDRLAFLLWPDDMESVARGNLRRHLHDLNRRLPDFEGGWVVSEAKSVCWNPAAPVRLDVADFDRLSREPQGLEQAEKLYQGDLLPDLYDDWMIVERELLRDRYLEVLECLISRFRARRELPRALGYARKAVLLEPLREEGLRRLIALHYEAGDRAAALIAYRELETGLQRELGAAPMPETVALYQAVLMSRPIPPGIFREEAEARPAPHTSIRIESKPAALPAGNTASAIGPPPHNLPAALTSFYGRQRELQEVCDFLARPEPLARLLTLTGPGGVGKTRLALEAADRLLHTSGDCFPDGVMLVSLAAVEQPDLVASTIGSALEIPAGAPPAAERLRAYLKPRRMLLVLDNYEQVIEAAALVSDLLQAAPGLRVLVTSREALQLYGEQEYPVPPLPLPELVLAGLPDAGVLDQLAANPAVALIVARAQASNPAFQLRADHANALVQVCALLDGLPLAIELAAARLRQFTPAELLESLRGSLEALSSPGRNLPTRQRTLFQAIDWSYRLLTRNEKRLFAALGVFTGSFDLPALLSIAQIPWPALDGEPPDEDERLSHLLDWSQALVGRSLLRQERPGLEGRSRFRLLLTLREFARQQLQASGLAAATHEAHAAYYLHLAEACGQVLGPEQTIMLDRLTQDLDNLRAALDWCFSPAGNPAAGVRIADALTRFWEVRSHAAEASQWFERAVEALRQVPAEAPRLALALDRAGMFNGYLQNQAAARRYALESLQLWRRLEDPTGIAGALNSLGQAEGQLGNAAAAVACLQEAMQIWQQLGNQTNYARSLANLANRMRHLGKVDEAHSMLHQALSVFRQLQHPQFITINLINLGMLCLDMGRLEEAAASFEEASGRAQELGHHSAYAMTIEGLGLVDFWQGDYASARARLETGLEMRRQLKDWVTQAMNLTRLGDVARQTGAYRQAGELYCQAFEIMAANEPYNYSAMVGFASLCLWAGAIGSPTRAVSLAATAQALSRESGFVYGRLLQRELDRCMDRLRNTLGRVAFEHAWSLGEQTVWQQALVAEARTGIPADLALLQDGGASVSTLS